MIDLEGLKKRIELVDVRLKTAHTARERDSNALKQLWEHIHGRFDEQTREIAELRTKVVDLEQVRNDLLGLMENFLNSVENGLESMTEETVPHIRQMAGELLGGREAPKVAAPTFAADHNYDREEPEIDENSAQDELLAAIERSLNDADDFPEPAEAEELALTTVVDDASTSIPDMNDNSPGEAPRKPVATDRSIMPISPGIRNLVQRLEGVTLQSYSSGKTDEKPVEEDDLSRDLREIEVLRGELMGLRERVSAGR